MMKLFVGYVNITTRTELAEVTKEIRSNKTKPVKVLAFET